MKNDMWEHNCPAEGPLAVGRGEACNWCGRTEEEVWGEYNGHGFFEGLAGTAAVYLVVGVILFFVLFISGASGATIHPERWYQERFCAAVHGEMEVVLSDRTRVDCLTATHAWEVDFAHKWAEGIGQSLHYARMTGRRPGIVLIVEKPEDLKYIETLTNTVKQLNVDIELRLVKP